MTVTTPVCVGAFVTLLVLKSIAGRESIALALYGREVSVNPRASVLPRWKICLQLRGGELSGQGDDENADTHDGFAPLSANDNERLDVDSLCMACGETGRTSILPTIIPKFGRIIIMAFACPKCHYSSNEVQSANEIQPFGLQFILNIEKAEDLNRQVLKVLGMFAALAAKSLVSSVCR
jgi:hypothetical protein